MKYFRLLLLFLVVVTVSCGSSDDDDVINNDPPVNQMEKDDDNSGSDDNGSDDDDDGSGSDDGSGNDDDDSGSNNTTLLQGDFMNDAHPTSGIAKINEGHTKLLFENFKTDTGPELLVYLSNDLVATEYVDLGDLQGIEGNFEYDLPDNVDFDTYKYVLIWCVAFSVDFGYAELE